MNRHAFLIVVCILELIVGVDGVVCSTHKILVELDHPIYPIMCNGMFGEKLSISPSLPPGLVFANNTIYGTIRQKIELTPFTITSVADKLLTFTVHIGVLAAPTRMYISDNDLLINRGIALEGIKIHSDVYFTDIIVDPLPEGIVLDQTRNMLVGTYIASFSGFYNVTIYIANSFGYLSQVFTFVLSTGLTNGLSYTIYDIPCGMTPNEFPDVFSIEKNLNNIKKGVLLSNNISSMMLDSELYIPHSNSSSCHLLSFTSYLYIEETGYYAFRMLNDNLNSKHYSYYRIFIDSTVVYDTWSNYPSPSSLLDESIWKMNFHDQHYHKVHIQYYTSALSFRNFDIQWIKPSSFHFQSIPTQHLWIKPSSIFQYSSEFAIVYVNQEFHLFPLIDYRIFTQNGELVCQQNYHLKRDITNITINSFTGEISGYTSNDGLFFISVDYYSQCGMNAYHYDATILVHSVLVDSMINLNYKRDDMIVTSLSVCLNEPIYLVPENTTEYTHYYSVYPALPVGLTLDSDTGIISGKSYTQLPTTCYTILLVTPFKTVSTILNISVASHMNTILFYGTITQNVTSIRYASNSTDSQFLNDEDWITTPVSTDGSFSFFVNPGHFIMEIPQASSAQIYYNTTHLPAPLISLYHTMGLIFVEDNNWYTGSLIFGNDPNNLYIMFETFSSAPPIIELYFEDVRNETVEVTHIQMSNYSTTYTVGTSIEPILLSVTNIHYPIHIEPATPYLSLSTIHHSCQRLTHPDNYMITGRFEETGVFEYTITSRNDVGSSMIILQFTIIPLSTSMNYLTIYDSIQHSYEYFYDLQIGNQVYFRKTRQVDHANTIVIPKDIQERIVIRICRYEDQLIVQPSIHVTMILNNQYQIFSTSFYRRSGSGIYLCETYSVYYKQYLSDKDEWKYYLSNGEYIYDWKTLNYDDSHWKSSHSFYPFHQHGVLYLRKIITLDETLHYSIFLFNLLVKEGVIVYVNNMEITRYNMNIDFASPYSDLASHSFYSYQYIPSSFSNLYFKPGKNCIAIEIHPHLTSSSYALFHLHLLQLFTNNYHYQPSYPMVVSSMNNSSAYSVINSPSYFPPGWTGHKNDTVFYFFEENEFHFVNGFSLLQQQLNTYCIQVFGISMYYDEFEQKQLIPVYLFDYSLIHLTNANQVHVDIPQAKSSYHGFIFHIRNIPSSGTVVLNQLLLNTNNQETCSYDQLTYVVGEEIRIPCSSPTNGIEVLYCYESNKGVEWEKKYSYCSDLKAKFGRMKVRFSVKGNGFSSIEKENEMNKVKQALASLLHVNEDSLSIYYHYSRINSQLLSYMEIYFELDISFWHSQKCLSLLKSHYSTLSKELSKQINRDVFIDVPGFSFGKQNWRILLVLCILVGVLLTSLALVTIQFSRKKLREREENRLLMC